MSEKNYFEGEVTKDKARSIMLEVLDDPDDMDPTMAEEIKERLLRWVLIPTGWIAAYFEDIEDGVSIPCCLWYLHGSHWTAKHDPTKLPLVGGAPPF